MPGVIVNTGVRAGSAGPVAGPFSTMFIVGTAERGNASVPTLVGSMNEVKKHLGDFTASGTLYQHLELFFEEGGTRAYVARLVGGDATTGTSTLGIGLNGGGSSAIVLTAANPGDWSENVSYDVVNNTTSFNLTITFKGETVLAGKYSSNAAAIKDINNNLSHILVATAGVSATLVSTQDGSLSAGDDDIAAVDAQTAVDALDQFDSQLGTGVVVMPGYVPTETVDVYASMRNHAVATRRLAFCGFDGETSSTAITTAADYEGSTDAEQADASHLAFFWPRVTAPDGLGGSRTLAAEVFAAAARCRAHIASGPWVAGAGVGSVAKFATGLEAAVTRETGDLLDAARVNALRVIDGAVRVYGARSASADEDNYRFYTYRDTINAIATQCETALERFVFQPIDSRGVLFAEMAAELTSILAPYADRGGLYALTDGNGAQIDKGYTVNVGANINPPAELAAGRVHAEIGVRVAAVAELVTLTITKSSLTAPV